MFCIDDNMKGVIVLEGAYAFTVAVWNTCTLHDGAVPTME